MTKKPNPGSREAVSQGCECPIMDNNYGRGILDGTGGVVFYMSEDCPIHGKPVVYDKLILTKPK